MLLVEDHDLLAQSLTFALRAEGFLVERPEALQHEAVLAAATKHRPGVVLLDLDLGPRAGSSLPLITPLRELGASVVMVTADTDPAHLARCVEAGALGIVSKAASFTDLVATVKEAAEMRSLLTRAQRDAMFTELRRQQAEDRRRLARFRMLTLSEREVLAALVEGIGVNDIAGERFVAVATVRTQVKSILSKLGVNSQLAAVALARRTSWTLEDAG